jgi:hypothetical protein
MTTEQLDPRRIDEEGPATLRALVRERRQGPSTEDLGKMSERLVALGVMRATSPQLATTRSSYAKIGGVALLVVGGLVAGWQTVREPAAPSGVTTAASAEAPLPAAVAFPTATPTHAISVNELPSAAPSPAPSAPTTAETRRSHAVPPVSELELVQRAEVALASNPRRALEIAGEHARTFPSGEFLQEREVIAVDALSRLGRKDESLRRARSLVERFPRTPYATRLEMAVGQPLMPTSKSAEPTETKTH